MAFSLIQLAIIAVVICGVIGIVFVIAKQTGVNIPAWIVTIAWIVLAVVVGVVAIKFLASMI